jgi:hypothetical protein
LGNYTFSGQLFDKLGASMPVVVDITFIVQWFFPNVSLP